MALGDLVNLTDIFGNQYLRAIVIFAAVTILLRIFLALVIRIFTKLSSRTKTDLDDLLINKASIPLTIISGIIGLQLGLYELQLSENFSIILDRIIYSVYVILFGYIAYAILDLFLVRVWDIFLRKSRIRLDKSLTSIIHGFLRIVFIGLAILYLLDLWGIEIGPLLAGLGIAGLAVALALQPTLANVFSGLSLIMDKSIKVGDLVYLDANTKGIIDKIGVRSTRIKTFDNEWIIIPNTKLAESQIQNVALPEPKSRVVIPFSVAYGSDIEKVKKIVMKEILTIKNLEKDPEPMVRFLEMADSALLFKAYFYVDTYDNRFGAIDEANTKIYNTLRKNKIEIPFPQMDVHLKK